MSGTQGVSTCIITIIHVFTLQDRSKALSSTNNVLSILHELSPAYSAPPTKRAKLRAACEKTPPSSGHPPRSKLDILLTQLQKRLSEVDQGTVCMLNIMHVHHIQRIMHGGWSYMTCTCTVYRS